MFIVICRTDNLFNAFPCFFLVSWKIGSARIPFTPIVLGFILQFHFVYFKERHCKCIFPLYFKAFHTFFPEQSDSRNNWRKMFPFLKRISVPAKMP